ncbi:MAG: hypothetical protein R3C28_15940 [Pirellulaceae bacterium]
MHSRDCDHCREIVPTLLASVPSTEEDSTVPPVRIALVDVKPGEPIYPASRTIVSTTLPASHEWFVSPPVAIRIHDGQVTDVCENKDELMAFVKQSSFSHPSPTRQRGTTGTLKTPSLTRRDMNEGGSHPSRLGASPGLFPPMTRVNLVAWARCLY